MLSNSKKAAIVMLSVASFYSNAQVNDWYLSGYIGNSSQTEGVTPYGNNIAEDSDFPSNFDSGDGGVFAIGLGYYIKENIRLEGRISYRDADFDETKFGIGTREGEEYQLVGKVESTVYSIDIFYDFRPNSLLRPYIKAGIGLAHNEFSSKLGGAGVADFDVFDGVVDGFYDLYSDESADNLSLNVGIGATYAFNDEIEGFVEYQYVALGDVATGQDSFTDGFNISSAAANEFSIGLKVKF